MQAITEQTLQIILLNGAISICTIVALTFYSDSLIKNINHKDKKIEKSSEDEGNNNPLSPWISKIFKISDKP